MSKIRVFIVDDSAIVREILTQKLAFHPKIEVVGSAMDPYIARDKLERMDVDVITLDIEMPRMDGLTFLRQLMKHYPRPVIMVSSVAQSSSPAALEAMKLGAVDVVPKPGGPFSVEEVVDILIHRILAASQADLKKLQSQAQEILSQDSSPLPQKKYLAGISTTQQLIAIGTSTGGTIALETILKQWRPDFPPTLVVIHMPERFTATFAQRLDTLCPVRVKEAENGEQIQMGTVYIAPGNFHMILKTQGTQRTLKITPGPKVFGQRPAVDPLFQSLAQQVGRNCLGVLLTGMGKDGAQGLLDIKQAGGWTLAQDEETSIVFGMPKEAIALGAADQIVALQEVPRVIAKKLGL